MAYDELVDEIGSVYEQSDFTFENARHDKIAFEISDYRFRSDSNDFHTLFLNLADLTVDDVPSNRLSQGQEAKIFNAAQSGFEYRRTISSIKARERYSPPAGKLLFHLHLDGKGRRNDYGPSDYHLTSSVKCNPTRFVRNKVALHGRMQGRGSTRVPLTLKDMFSCAHDRFIEGELSQDGNDNVLLGSGWNSALNDAEYRLLMDRYLRFVAGLPEDLIEAARDEVTTGFASHALTYRLDWVEVYWERASINPLFDVRQLSERLLAYGRSFQAFSYGSRETQQAQRTGRGRMRNAFYATLPIRNGVTLVVYAKTNFRIRFELRYDLKNCKELIERRTTTSSINAMLEWIDMLTDHAAEVMISWSDRLVLDRGPASNFDTTREFLEAFFQLGLPSGKSETLFQFFVLNGCYVVGSDPEMNRAVERLKRLGIVETSTRGVRSLSSRYLDAVVALRGALIQMDDG
ncbi:MAG: hypothetical protein H6882_06615 [Rhodobiaceae bacterium]|nr:hypothetical protein [Rhodobiaceae bacterium]